MADRDLIQTAYDRNAHTYDAKFTPLQHPKYVALFGPNGAQFPTGRPCLDLGCGSGLLATWLRQQGCSTEDLIGVDLSHTMLTMARAHGFDVVHADAAALPFADATFRAVVSITVLGLVENHEETMLNEASRVLMKGGLLVVSVLETYANARFTKAIRRSGLTIDRVLPCGQDIAYIAHKTG